MFSYLLLSHCYFWLSFANFGNLVNIVLARLVHLVNLDIFYNVKGKKLFHKKLKFSSKFQSFSKIYFKMLQKKF